MHPHIHYDVVETHLRMLYVRILIWRNIGLMSEYHVWQSDHPVKAIGHWIKAGCAWSYDVLDYFKEAEKNGKKVCWIEDEEWKEIWQDLCSGKRERPPRAPFEPWFHY